MSGLPHEKQRIFFCKYKLYFFHQKTQNRKREIKLRVVCDAIPSVNHLECTFFIFVGLLNNA